jgi:GNAT superfamily N-acetyltransferase
MMGSTSTDRYTYLADQPQLLPILADWFYEEWGDTDAGRSPEYMRQVLSSYLNRDRIPLAIVRMRGSRPIATASLKIREMETHPQYLHWLGGVYVHPDFREQGIGSQLVEFAAREAQKFSVQDLYLYTRSHASFYSRLGWQEIERTLYKNRAAVIMKRNLSTEEQKEE